MNTRNSSLSAAIALSGVVVAVTASAAHWPAWRGPEGMGVCEERNLPTRWTTNENVGWRVPLPEAGNSTPIVWGKRIFITQPLEKEGRRVLMCFDRADGKLLWQQGPAYASKELTHDTNPQCSPSPVTDGERVVAWFGSAGLYCYDLDGKELWHRDLGEQRHIWGYGGSPVLHGDLCILNFGPGERTFLIAVDKKNGQDIWQVEEAGGHSGEKKPGEDKAPWIGSWSTPVLIKTEGREELLMTWPKRVAALDPKSGKEFWTCAGLNPLVYTSPLYANGIVVAMGGFNGMALAVKPGGSGEVTSERRLWHHPRTKQRIGSGVIHDGHIYIHNDPGVAECFELKTGNLVWEERLKGPAPKSENWSSLVLADGKLYSLNQSGETFVLKASPKFEILAINSLGESSNSSLAPSDGAFFIRTHKALWCISQKKLTSAR